MSDRYEYPVLTREPGKVGKPDVYLLRVKHPDLEPLQEKGRYLGVRGLELALKYAEGLSNDVRRIGV